MSRRYHLDLSDAQCGNSFLGAISDSQTLSRGALSQETSNRTTILAFGAQDCWTWLTILLAPSVPLLPDRYQPPPHTTRSLFGMAFIVSSVLRIPQTAL